MARRRSWWLSCAALLASVTCASCGHSEDEWQQKVHEADDLRAKLDAEQAQGKKAKGELDASSAGLEQLKRELAAAGIDVAKLNEGREAQARAMDEHRRRAEHLDAWRQRHDLLRDKLAPLAGEGVSVTVIDNRLTVSVADAALFDAGRDALKKDGRARLLKIADVIRAAPVLSRRSYQIGGHVDASTKGKDPWAVSLSRAREVLLVLVAPEAKGGGGLDPARLSAAGHGDAVPLSSNDSPEGRARNRRVEIQVLPAPDELADLRSLHPRSP